VDFTKDIHPRRFEAFQIAPMVDVVFILLAFFVMATEFRPSELDFDMDYRQAALSAGAEAADFPEHVSVQLLQSGTQMAIVVGHARLQGDTLSALTEKLREIGMPSIPVRVMADPSLSVGQVAAALDAVLASPMKRLSVSRLNIVATGRSQ
jgi:biopolymer transport protein ExbD